MNQTAKHIADFRVSWIADHEQYYQGRGIACTGYTHSGQGCGETLREAFEDALDNLSQQLDSPLNTSLDPGDQTYREILAELTSQVKELEVLDLDIVRAECPEQGEHTTIVSGDCAKCGEPDGSDHGSECAMEHPDFDPDCAVCAGEWHFYVNVDVRVE